MYEQVQPTKQMPDYLEKTAVQILDLFKSLDRGDQVMIFKSVQKQLADHRIAQTEEMTANHERLASEIKDHIDGTNQLASALQP